MMQRKIYIFCLALSMIAFIPRTNAQKGKSEISASYGLYSAYTFYVGKPYSASSGVGMLNYKYYVSNKVTLGMTFGYENISSWGSYVSFVPEFTYTYLDTKQDYGLRIKLYGGAALGLTGFNDFAVGNDFYATHHDESGVRPTGQVTPFGMRIGRKFAGFAEVGYGYKGLLNFGLAFRFRTKAMPSKEN